MTVSWIRLAAICIDYTDAHVMAEVVSRLLGWEMTSSESCWVLMRKPAGGTRKSFQAG